ncbi:substrate-binding domain-containing protein [Streptomyces sp. NPDC004610]|uniref:substrate-binding domain-containing protein n=1 Tax=unclassified Streptomyces TaxID=2593676 RepID=UPI0033B06FC5
MRLPREGGRAGARGLLGADSPPQLLLGADPPPQALVCADSPHRPCPAPTHPRRPWSAPTNLIAIGALGIARVRGPDVPGDLAVTGYDDDIEAASLVSPALTTVFNPGRAAARLRRNARGTARPAR